MPPSVPLEHFVRRLGRWSLKYLAVWLAGTVVVFFATCGIARISPRDGWTTVLTTPHLLLVLIALPFVILLPIWLSVLNNWFKRKRRRMVAMDR